MTAYAVMLTSDDYKDYPKAIIYFRKAIAHKDPNAHWLLGK
jgi:TPR repeat protein